MSKTRLSIRNRIAISMSTTILMLVPVILLGMYYIGQINRLTITLTEIDTQLLRMGNTIIQNFVQVRNAERDFLLSGDTIYLTTGRITLNQIALIGERSRNFAPELKNHLDSLFLTLAIYRQLFDSLDEIYRLQQTSPPNRELEELKRTRDQLLAELQTTDDPKTIDSLLTLLNRIDQNIQLTHLITSRSTSFHQQLTENANRIIALGEKITTRANQRIADNKTRITRLATWGQRNVITAIMLVSVLLIYLIVRIPNSLVLPIKRIAHALSRAEQGDLNIRVTINTNAELGDLARQINRVFAQLRNFDERKANHILELERRFRLLASNIKEGVLVVDRLQQILFANPALQPLLGSGYASTIGKPVREFPSLQPFLPYLEKLLSGATSHQECEILPGFSSSAVCFETLRDREGAIVGAMIIIINPTPPEPIETD